MVFSPEIINLSGMLDDPDDRIGVNLLAQLLLREDELPIPLNQNSVNLSIGVSIPLGMRMF